MHWTPRREKFRAILAGDKCIHPGSVYDAMSARCAEDIGFELGVGFNFYLPFVTISPEIKISNGLTNIHQVDPNLKYSRVLDQILSRMIVFSIHFED